MNDSELVKLLTDGESDRVEYKESIGDGNKISQTICAFANDLPNHQKPSVIFVGIDDNGTCANFTIKDRHLITLANMRSHGNILPIPSLRIQQKNLNGCDLIAVIVEPAYAPPVRYKGRVWVRVGSTNRTASAEEERRLAEKRQAKDLPYDLQPIRTASLADLDLNLFQNSYLPASVSSDILSQNQRSIEEQLASLRFITPNHTYSTVLGLLVVGKNPRDFLRGAYVQFLRIDGEELTDPIKDNKEIDGPLPYLLKQVDSLFQTNISVTSNLTTGPIEIRQPNYPIVALQQIIYNAILHRTYQGTNAPIRITWFNNRIEIQNPGGPFGQVTHQNFGESGITDYRNVYLAESMKNLGYVQRFGMGIPLARKVLEQNGNPPLDFYIRDTNILVIIRNR